MAGGAGQRFWPLSRTKIPKQFLNFSGKDKLLNETIGRIEKLITPEDVYIITNGEHVEKVKKIISENAGKENIIAEPAMRNTAPCIGYVAMQLKAWYGDCIMCIFPSDHYIENEDEFVKTVNIAIETARREEVLVAIGIEPTYPATGYGYIKYCVQEQADAKSVVKFVEKPQYEIAKEYVESKEFLWNSGIYICRVSTILKEIERFIPKLYSRLLDIRKAKEDGRDEAVQHIYQQLESISIDYGVMERSNIVKVIPSNHLGWNDIGSWESLNVFHKMDCNGNVTIGDNVNIDTKNSIVYSDGRMIATLGIENLIVVETEDVILICDRNRGQDIKRLVEVLEEKKMNEYL